MREKKVTGGVLCCSRLLIGVLLAIGLLFGMLIVPPAFAVEESDETSSQLEQKSKDSEPSVSTSTGDGDASDAAESQPDGSELPDDAVELGNDSLVSSTNTEDSTLPQEDDETGTNDSSGAGDDSSATTASGGEWAIGEEEVTQVVKDTVDFTFADLFIGWDYEDESEDWSTRYQTRDSSDDRVDFKFSRYIYAASQNDNTTVQQSIEQATLYVDLVKSSDTVTGEVVDFEDNDLYIYDLSADRSETVSAYLRDGDELIEYELTINYEGVSQEPKETLDVEFSAASSGKKSSSSDKLVSYVTDYADRTFTIASNNADWLLFDDTYSNGTSKLAAQTVFLEQEHKNYQYYLYNSKTHEVAIYRVNLTNKIVETPDETLEVNVNRNNQWEAGTEVYTAGAANPDFQLVSGYVAGYSRYEFQWSAGDDSGTYYSDTFYHSGTRQLVDKLSFVEYQTWVDNSGVTRLIKLLIHIDNQTPETVKEKEFTQDIPFNGINGKVKAVEFVYNEHRTLTKYITYDTAGEYTASEYIDYQQVSTENRFIELTCRNSYDGVCDEYGFDDFIDEYAPDVFRIYPGSSYYEGAYSVHITGLPNKTQEIISIDLALDDYDSKNVSSEDKLLTVSGYHHRSGDTYLATDYYLGYSAVYDGIHSYTSNDWGYSSATISDSGSGAEPIQQSIAIYQSKDHEITKIYTVDLSLESRKYVEKPAVDISLSQANNWDYLEEKTVSSADGALQLLGYYRYSEYASSAGGSYSSTSDSFSVNSSSPNEDVIIDDPYLYWYHSQHFDGTELDSEYTYGTLEDFAYTYNTKTGEYAQYQVKLVVNNTYVNPASLERKSFDAAATEYELISYQSKAGKEFSQDFRGRTLSFNIFKDKYHLFTTSNGEERPGDLFINEYSATYGPVATKVDDTHYTLPLRAGADVTLTITGPGEPEIKATGIALSSSELVVAAGKSATTDTGFIKVTPASPTVAYLSANSDNTNVANAYASADDANVYVYGYKPGTATVTVSTANGKTAQLTVVVKQTITSFADLANTVSETSTCVTVAADGDNVLPVGAELAVTKLRAEETSEQYKEVYDKVNTLTNGKFELFDINLVNKQEDRNVQPNGQVAVYMPIPDGFDPAKVKVYHYNPETNKREKVSGYVEEIEGVQYYVFYTTHFSYYLLEEALMRTVTFDAGDGVLALTDKVRTVTDGSELGSLPEPTRVPYAFDGWYTAAIGGDEVSESTVITADTTCYAHWTNSALQPDDGEEPDEEPGEEPSEEPSDGGEGSGAFTPLPETALTKDSQEHITGAPTATAGAPYRLKLDQASGIHEGNTVYAYIYSQPSALKSTSGSATHTVQRSESGELFIDVLLPSNYSGEHKIAVYDEHGQLLGWTPVNVVTPAKTDDKITDSSDTATTPSDIKTANEKADTFGGLASTGASTDVVFALLVVCALTGAALVVLRKKSFVRV